MMHSKSTVYWNKEPNSNYIYLKDNQCVIVDIVFVIIALEMLHWPLRLHFQSRDRATSNRSLRETSGPANLSSQLLVAIFHLNIILHSFSNASSTDSSITLVAEENLYRIKLCSCDDSERSFACSVPQKASASLYSSLTKAATFFFAFTTCWVIFSLFGTPLTFSSSAYYTIKWEKKATLHHALPARLASNIFPAGILTCTALSRWRCGFHAERVPFAHRSSDSTFHALRRRINISRFSYNWRSTTPQPSPSHAGDLKNTAPLAPAVWT